MNPRGALGKRGGPTPTPLHRPARRRARAGVFRANVFGANVFGAGVFGAGVFGGVEAVAVLASPARCGIEGA